MRPAWSVILLTTLLGAGQGLLLALFAADLSVAARGGGALAPAFIGWATIMSLALAGGGLLASFFHLGRPERAWRAAAMWRTSWLSREVIALPLFMALVAAYGLAHALGQANVALLLGALAALACVALFVCTGMIYATLQFLQEWHHPLTVINFFLFGGASGLTLAAALAAAVQPSLARPYAIAAIIVTALGWVTRAASLARNARLRQRSTLSTAIGIKHPHIVQKSQGAMGGSFNTHEFFHGRTAQLLRLVRIGFPIAAFVVPLALLAIGWYASAFVVHFAGLLAERWYFFAEARHPQNLYYQAIS